jgi:hydroxyethylthiazole kinase
MIEKIEDMVLKLKSAKPVVLSLTNYVTMDFVANALLALGAAPIMSVCDDELEELIAISSSLNINIGTLNQAFIDRCHKAVVLAKRHSVPVVLDPVGSGASRIRTQTARALLKLASIVRGNASEIISLYEDSGKTLGVESINSTDEAKEKATQLAKQYRCTVIASGPVDFITDGNREALVHYGSALMPLVTGMGCALTAVVAAFRGVMDDSFESARLATSYFGMCGQSVGTQTKAPGTFRLGFVDALHMANCFKEFTRQPDVRSFDEDRVLC